MIDICKCPDTGELWVEDGFANDWQPIVRENDETFEVHVTPMGDSGAHLLHEECPCCPYMNDSGAWVHRAYDDRDAFEQKKRRPS